tara:strand:+ start:983 stop:1771 length:789 start_codon:yes stop_codon:yes gene_type:complete
MLGQEKNIKGFNILELLVVIAIIGAISTAAYPKFSEWNKERKIRYGTEKLLRVLKDIKVQTDRSTFAYVQVLFLNDENRLFIETKGMTMQTLATKMNNGADEWNTSPNTRCDTGPSTGDDAYWDTDRDSTSAEIKNAVYSTEITEITTNLETGAICFARNGKFFEADGEIEIDDSSVPYGFILICQRDSQNEFCPVEYSEDPETKPDLPLGSETEFLRTVNWTRFGEFSVNTFKKCYNDADVHVGGYWDDADEDEKNEKCPT